MDLLTVKEWWTAFVAGPEVLFGLRMASAGILALYACLCWWEVFSPPERRAGRPAWERTVWHLLRGVLAISITGLFTYFLFAGNLERDRVGTPVRLIYGNLSTSLTFWVLCLHAVMRRVESWRRRAARGERL
ncbi:hypothetical protein ACFFLM_19085 [Deinococcus oregonensis]|uniref:Transmembrane protein n=1 Tax=Deinococcus oregonensis TaxID=1805970 RepID=A0ABV6B2S7_9DEIO